MSDEISGIEKITDKIAKQQAALVVTHKNATTFYGLKETEETAKDSKEFLRIFSDFFKNASECLEKTEKKRGGGRVKETK